MPRYHKTLAIILLAICVGSATLYLVDFFDSFDLSTIASTGQWMPALGMQIVGIWLLVLAWKLLLAMRHHPKFGWPEAFAHIGITMMGRYLPGKNWGYQGRAFLLAHRGLTKDNAFSLILADQFLILYSGAAIGVFSLIAVIFPIFISFLLLLAIVASVPVILYGYSEIGDWLQENQRDFLSQRLPLPEDPEHLTIVNGSFSLSIISYAAHWIVSAWALCILFEPMISIDSATNTTLIFAAIPLAAIAAFIAIRVPGGVGVKEVVMLAVLLVNMPFGLALAIAISHRLLGMLMDLLLGVWALLYLSYTFPGKKSGKKAPAQSRSKRGRGRPQQAAGRRGTSAQ